MRLSRTLNLDLEAITRLGHFERGRATRLQSLDNRGTRRGKGVSDISPIGRTAVVELNTVLVVANVGHHKLVVNGASANQVRKPSKGLASILPARSKVSLFKVLIGGHGRVATTLNLKAAGKNGSAALTVDSSRCRDGGEGESTE